MISNKSLSAYLPFSRTAFLAIVPLFPLFPALSGNLMKFVKNAYCEYYI